MADETPVKRGPGRPRKIPADTPVEVTPEVVTEPALSVAETRNTGDPRIGQPVDEKGAHGVMFPDGKHYRCENDVVVERLD